MNDLKIVGVSGGPDSMAMLDMLYKENNILVVAHVNYQKRDSAKRDEMIVRNYCLQRNIIFEVSYFEDNSKGSFQAIARKFRYDFFTSLYKKYNAKALYIAHHKLDIIETYLLKKKRNVINESYLINSNVLIQGMNVVRPLLNYHKTDIYDYCEKNNIEYGIDESNLETHYSRNKIRRTLENLSLNELNQIYNEAIVEDENYKKMSQKMEKYVLENLRYAVNDLKKLNQIELHIFLYKCLQKYVDKLAAHKIIKNSLVLKLKQFLESDKKNINEFLLNDIYMIKEYDYLIFESIKSENYLYIFKESEITSTKHFRIDYFGENIQGITLKSDDYPITIRNIRDKDKIELKDGHKLVSRLFIDKKIPRNKRITWPILLNKNGKILLITELYKNIEYKQTQNSIFVIK